MISIVDRPDKVSASKLDYDQEENEKVKEGSQLTGEKAEGKRFTYANGHA